MSIKFAQPIPPPVTAGLEIGGGTVLNPLWAQVFQSFCQVLSARGFSCEIEQANGALGIKDGTSILIGTGALTMTIIDADLELSPGTHPDEGRCVAGAGKRAGPSEAWLTSRGELRLRLHDHGNIRE